MEHYHGPEPIESLSSGWSRENLAESPGLNIVDISAGVSVCVQGTGLTTGPLQVGRNLGRCCLWRNHQWKGYGETVRNLVIWWQICGYCMLIWVAVDLEK